MAKKQNVKSNFSKVDEYGFERPDDFDYESYEEFMSSYIKVLVRRSKKWSELLGESATVKRNLTLKRYIRKGIPSEHRGRIWFIVSGAEELKSNMSSNLYKSLLLEDGDSNIIETIQLDLPRTYPDNIYFKTKHLYQSQLYNILVAYAQHNTKVGYCQGLNYIAGLLLLVTKSEEATFWLLKMLVEQILEDYYSPSMEGLIVDIEVFSLLVNLKMPDLHQHVATLGLPWAVITTKWFICLFAEVLPIETVLRIWDCLFNEGSKMLFRVGLTLLKIHSAQLLACEDLTDLSNCFNSIIKDFAVLECHHFIYHCFKSPGSLSNNTILKLREQVANDRAEQKLKKQNSSVNNLTTSSTSVSRSQRQR